MKKYGIPVLAAVLLSAGCQRTEQPAREPNVIRASAEDPADTKVYYGSDRTFLWQNGDKLCLWTDWGWFPGAMYAGKSGTKDGLFTLVMDDIYHSCAVYPSLLGSTYDGGGKMTLALEDSYVLEIPTPVLMPMVAYFPAEKDRKYLHFKHVGGAVKLTFRNVPAGYHTFRLLADKPLSGLYDLDLTRLGTDGCKAVAGRGRDGRNHVDVNLIQEAPFSQISIYVPVPAGDLKLGAELLIDGKSVFRQPVGNHVNHIGRGTILRMPTITIK